MLTCSTDVWKASGRTTSFIRTLMHVRDNVLYDTVVCPSTVRYGWCVFTLIPVHVFTRPSVLWYIVNGRSDGEEGTPCL